MIRLTKEKIIPFVIIPAGVLLYYKPAAALMWLAVSVGPATILACEAERKEKDKEAYNG